MKMPWDCEECFHHWEVSPLATYTHCPQCGSNAISHGSIIEEDIEEYNIYDEDDKSPPAPNISEPAMKLFTIAFSPSNNQIMMTSSGNWNEEELDNMLAPELAKQAKEMINQIATQTKELNHEEGE